MSMQITDQYSNLYANQISKSKETNSTEKKILTEEKKVDVDSYLKELQKKNPEINIMAGKEDKGAAFTSASSKTDVIIAPNILAQMASDPEAAQKYEKMLSNIPALDKWADAMIKGVTGSNVKYRQVWIDEEGNMGSLCVTEPDKERQEWYAKRKKNEKDQAASIAETRKLKKEQFEKWIKEIQSDKANTKSYEVNFSDMSKYMGFDKKI